MIKRTISLALTAAAVAAATGTMVAQPAHAETDGGTTGRVVAASGLAERSIPSTTGTRLGTLAHGQKFGILCKVHGRPVDGNDLWYARSGHANTWVSARYVANVGSAPRYCGHGVEGVGRATTTVNRRVAPSTADPKAGTIAKGGPVAIVCQTAGRSVLGTKDWYYLGDGRWVSAHYVNGFEGTPVNCT